jgi:hypothetical protein
MRNSLVLLLAAAALHAAAVRGVVVEHSSGKPLARTQIVVAPLPGTPGEPRSLRTNTYGNFAFSVPAGTYLVSAARRGFPTVHYGQKNWRAAGMPVVVTDEKPAFLTIRMPRYGAITGVVTDENDVGLPDHEVVAYRYGKPPHLVARGQADERGIFRVSGLEPGRYLVRTVARLYEDGGYLPTFSRETMRVDEAIFVDVDLDREVGEARVRPFPGRLYTIAGMVYAAPPSPVTLTLVSDVGRETITTNGAFRFPNKPPGPYEIWARTQDGQGAYVPFTLEERDWNGRVTMLPLCSVFFNFRGPQGQQIDPSSVTVQVRRVDLAGESPAENEQITGGRAGVVQGRWQFRITPNQQYVATDFRGCRGERPEGGRADGWNETMIVQQSCMVAYTLSSHPSTVRGTVSSAHEPVPGAPVFLEPWDPKNQKRLGEPHTIRTDVHGKYELIGLAPGTYRLVSTFEYANPEAVDMDEMQPRTLVVEEGRDQQQDVDLFIIR